jgi:hypothetical protein
MATYYDKELQPIIDETSEFAPRLQISGSESTTKWMNISKRQAKKILAILNEGK